jgi:hypothetical protein
MVAFDDGMCLRTNLTESDNETASKNVVKGLSASTNPAAIMSTLESSLLGISAEIRLYIRYCVLNEQDNGLVDPQIRHLAYPFQYIPRRCFEDLGSLKTSQSLTLQDYESTSKSLMDSEPWRWKTRSYFL